MDQLDFLVFQSWPLYTWFQYEHIFDPAYFYNTRLNPKTLTHYPLDIDRDFTSIFLELLE